MDCGGRAERRHRFPRPGVVPKAAWRFASRRTPNAKRRDAETAEARRELEWKTQGSFASHFPVPYFSVSFLFQSSAFLCALRASALSPDMRAFVGPVFHLTLPPPMPHVRVAYLLSDSLDDLKAFAHLLHVAPATLRWSNAGVPHFIIGLHVRDIALRRGAIAVDRAQLAGLVRLWRTRQRRSLTRLQSPPRQQSSNPF